MRPRSNCQNEFRLGILGLDDYFLNTFDKASGQFTTD